jgi:hypothetical protein
MQVAAQRTIAETNAFPQQLAEVPPAAIVRQSISFMPAALAIGCIVGLVGYVYVLATGDTALQINQLYSPAGCFVASLLAGSYEIWRRGRVLSFVCAGTQVAAYRKGMLVSSCPRSEIVYFELRTVNTVRELAAFGFLGSGCLVAAAVNITTNFGAGLIPLGAGIALLGGAAASAYARIICSQYIVPVNRNPTRVGLTRNAVAKLDMTARF